MSSVKIQSSGHFSVDKYVLQGSLQPRLFMTAMQLQSWTDTVFHISLLHKILHSPSVEHAVRAIPTSEERFLKEFKDCNKYAFKCKKKSVKRWGEKKGKWNPVTCIIWLDDSSLVKGIGTAVLAGSPPNVIASASSQPLLFSVTLCQVIVKAEHLSAPAEKVAPPCQ